MAALSKQDEDDLRASDLDPKAERLVREAWGKEKRHPALMALDFSLVIAVSGVFVGSAYEKSLVPFVESLVPFVWGLALVYALAGLFIYGMSKTEPDLEFHSKDSVHLTRLLVRSWRGMHDAEYAVGFALSIMFAISLAAAGYLELAFAYAAAYGVLHYGIVSLKKRTGKVVSMLSHAK